MTYINELLSDKKRLKDDLSEVLIEKSKYTVITPEYKPLLERQHVLECELHILEMLLKRKGGK